MDLQQEFEQSEKGADCPFYTLPDTVRRIANEIMAEAHTLPLSHVSENRRANYKRQFISRSLGECFEFNDLCRVKGKYDYPKATDSVMRFWKFKESLRG